MMYQKRYHLLFVLLLFLLPFVRYWQTIFGYWRWDDTVILMPLLKIPLWKYFCIPSVYQGFSCSNLTPWVLFSYDVDLALFGLNPSVFYLHHLLSLSFIAIAGYYFLSLWVNRKFAFLGMILFINGAPVAIIMQQLMTRHYLEGLLFAILSLYGFVVFLRGKKYRYLAGSVFFYILAVTAKEIYVPLVFLLPWIPEQSINVRFKTMVPYVIIVFCYIVWRQCMIGSLVGGYVSGSSDSISLAVRVILDNFANIPSLLVGDWWKLLFSLYILMVVFHVVMVPSSLWFGTVVFACILLPLTPLASHSWITAPDRYLFLVWFVVSFLFTCCFEKLSKKTLFLPKKTMSFVSLLIWLIVLVIIGMYGYGNGKKTQQVAKEYDTQGRFVWMTHDKDVAFIPSPSVLAGYWYISCLAKIKSCVQRNYSSPKGIVDDFFLRTSIKKLFIYDVENNRMKDITALLPEKIMKMRAAVRKASLSVYLHYESSIFSWRFGPYVKGCYRFIVDESSARVLPPAGNLRIRLSDVFSFRIRYSSPDGWTTYSPLFTFNPHGMSINWEQK